MSNRWITTEWLRLDLGGGEGGRRPATVSPAVAPWPEGLAPRRSSSIERYGAPRTTPEVWGDRERQGDLT